ncbi:MAG: hypothetical protein QOI07_2847 [Verrucomicrobiota bacterium]
MTVTREEVEHPVNLVRVYFEIIISQQSQNRRKDIFLYYVIDDCSWRTFRDKRGNETMKTGIDLCQQKRMNFLR